MADAVCVVPVSPIRSEPAHKSEMVTQLLFGDMVSILEEAGYWLRVRLQYDGYEGWCTGTHLLALSENNKEVINPVFTGEWVNVMYLNDAPMYLPVGCDISFFLNAANFGGSNHFRYEGKFLDKEVHQRFEDRVAYISQFFLNTAYLWGGRSVFGIDCSGFTQLVFRMAGKQILRDAWQQATQGNRIEFEKAQKGDLAFFTNEEGRVVHVGILLEHDRIIHAAGKVRIDLLNHDGIFNVETKAKTHTLSGFKRYS